MAYASPLEYNVVQESPHNIWNLDLDCNNHMTGNLNLFSSLDNSVQTNVRLGKNVQVMFFWKRYCWYSNQTGGKYIPHVYHVKGLKRNLLSIGKLIQKG